MLALEVLRGTRYEARLTELLTDPECVVIEHEHGFAMWSPIAGAEDVIKLHFLTGDVELPEPRFVIAELPDDAPFAAMTTTLLSSGFREEGRVNDFVADGIAMRFLVRRAD